jgi:uncharacterized surface protein with fasciclin (FAS1) repeats
MTPLLRTGFAALALAALPLLGGCGEAEDKQSAPVTQDDATLTLAAALGANKALGTFQSAIEQSELSGVLDGRASYTVLAPKDRAFAALGEDGAALLEDEQRPVLIAILRDHMLPGHLTLEAIGAAIDRRGGPVTMTTLGQTEVQFARSGETLTVTMDGGASARVSGTAIAANNGVLIPIDTVLLPPRG